MTDPQDPADMLARRYQAMGLLMRGITHDFNNILAIIEGYAHILHHHIGSDPQWHDKIDAILTATGRGTELTRALQAFSPASKPSATRPATSCDLVTVLQDNRPIFRSLFSSRVELAFQLPSSPLLLDCSSGHALEILIPLCDGLRQTITGTGRVLFTVACPDEEQAVITVTGPDNRSVSCTLPRLAARNSLQDKTVLIVDDEEALLPVIEHQLRSMGLNVLKAANADTALLLQKDYPDVIDFLLTDIVMPEVDGVELAERMTDNRPRMGVVYMTGYASRAAGIDIPDDSPVVPKPLRPETLSLAFQKALEQVQDA